MCVIIYKPKGAEMPSLTTLIQCSKANPDGFGFATPTKNFKSMKFTKFVHELSKVEDSEPCIIHFRWATHGSKKVSNCHPFNMGDVWFAHNGILPIEPIDDLTDSETAFRTILYPVLSKTGLKSKKFENVVNNIIGCSRFVFMKGNKVRLFGDWYQYDNCYFSNMRWYNYYEYRFFNNVV